MYWRVHDNGVSVTVKVQPRARRPGLQSAEGDRLRIGVAEPPEDGRANRAVCETLAVLLDVPPSAVRVAMVRAVATRRCALPGIQPHLSSG
jgi:uncharacterized protein YggU (UPF0235/DUF167 family)